MIIKELRTATARALTRAEKALSELDREIKESERRIAALEKIFKAGNHVVAWIKM